VSMTEKVVKKLYKMVVQISFLCILTHIFQHILFDWLKFTWDLPILYGSHMIWWDPCEF